MKRIAVCFLLSIFVAASAVAGDLSGSKRPEGPNFGGPPTMVISYGQVCAHILVGDDLSSFYFSTEGLDALVNAAGIDARVTEISFDPVGRGTEAVPEFYQGPHTMEELAEARAQFATVCVSAEGNETDVPIAVFLGVLFAQQQADPTVPVGVDGFTINIPAFLVSTETNDAIKAGPDRRVPKPHITYLFQHAMVVTSGNDPDASQAIIGFNTWMLSK